MPPIDFRTHRLLDITTVVIFALAPLLFGLTGAAAVLAYALAVVHLTLTMLTRFPDRIHRSVPLALHGIVETAVGPALVVIAFASGWQGASRLFYIAAGAVILFVRIFSAYDHPSEAEAAADRMDGGHRH